jgi:hypothetical protein
MVWPPLAVVTARLILRPPAHPKNLYAIMESTWWRNRHQELCGRFYRTLKTKDKAFHQPAAAGFEAALRTKFKDS